MPIELTVVVEEREDAVLLRRLIARALDVPTGFYSGRGRTSLVTLARNVLIQEGGPVLVAMNANTSYPDLVDEIRGTARYAIEILSEDAVFHVHAFVPQLEVIFYEARCVLRRRFGREIEGMELELGKLDPRRQLDRLLAREGTDRGAFYRSLNQDDLDQLLRAPQMRPLIAAAEALMARVGAAIAC